MISSTDETTALSTTTSDTSQSSVVPSDVAEELKGLQTSLKQVATALEKEWATNTTSTRGGSQPPEASNIASANVLKAKAIGGLFGLAQGLVSQQLEQTTSRGDTGSIAATTKPQKSIWETALNAANEAGQNYQKQTAFKASEVSIECWTGNASKAKYIGFVVFGFMTQDQKNDEGLVDQWRQFAEKFDLILYRICWPTGNVANWNQFLSYQQGQQWYAKAGSNPWHVAQSKTVQIGKVLSRFLKRIDNTRKLILIGHSLGGAIVYETLKQLTTNNNNKTTETSCNVPMVNLHAIALGGAFVANKVDVERILSSELTVLARWINAYNPNDHVLQVAFRAASLDVSPPAGTIPLAIHHQVETSLRHKLLDLDMSDHIPQDVTTMMGHSYEGTLQVLAEKLQGLL